MATKLKNGLKLHLDGKITSVPYINMTLSLLNQIGVETSFEGQLIQVKPYLDTVSKTLTVESDWSSASYFYSIIALSPVGTQINLSTYKKDSLQGDAVLQAIYKQLGVTTTFEGSNINLKKTTTQLPDCLNLDLANAPDIAQTIVVSLHHFHFECV